jgi:thiol-disulfide isomerase/thioredoxin
MVFSGIFYNFSGTPRYVVLTNRQLAIYNQTRETTESPDPRQKIIRREGLLSLNPNPVLKRVIYEDIFRLAVEANDAGATLKYARALYHLDPSDTQVLAKAALVLAKRRMDLDQALTYARIAVKATAQFQPTRRPPNTPEKIFQNYFPEQKQRETYRENCATALHALALVFHQRGDDRQAEVVLRKSIDAKPSTARTRTLIAILRNLGRTNEADALAAKITEQLGEVLERKFVNQPVENLELKAIDGSHYDLASLKGRVVLINFWATWCGPCREELPLLVDLYQKYKERGLEILSISTDDDQALVSSFARGYNLTFPVFYDTGTKDRLNVDVIPTSIFVGRDGNIHYRNVGFNEESIDEIEAVINKLLDKSSSRAEVK